MSISLFKVGVVFIVLIGLLYLNNYYIANSIINSLFLLTIYFLCIASLWNFRLGRLKNGKLKINRVLFTYSLVIAICLYCLNYFFTYMHSLVFNGIDNIILRGYEYVSLEQIVFSILAYPLVEELLFRGSILNILSKKVGNFKAVLLSSLLFAIAHIFSISSVLLSFFSGIIFGYVYLKTHHVVYSYLVHLMYNGFVLYFNDKLNIFILNLNLNKQVIGLIALLILSIVLLNFSLKKISLIEEKNIK